MKHSTFKSLSAFLPTAEKGGLPKLEDFRLGVVARIVDFWLSGVSDKFTDRLQKGLTYDIWVLFVAVAWWRWNFSWARSSGGSSAQGPYFDLFWNWLLREVKGEDNVVPAQR